MASDDPQSPFAYMNSVSDARALMVNEDDWSAGNTLLSMETTAEVQDDLITYIRDNFRSFLRYLRYLTKSDQELMLSYYLLGVSQSRLAKLTGLTQTGCSQRLRRASRLLAYLAYHEGPPHDLMITLSCPKDIAEWVVRYRQCLSLVTVAHEVGVPRPELRRRLVVGLEALVESEDIDQQGMGEYLRSLLDGKDPRGEGESKVAQRRLTTIRLTDPTVFGEFRGLPDFDGLTPRASDHVESGDDQG